MRIKCHGEGFTLREEQQQQLKTWKRHRIKDGSSEANMLKTICHFLFGGAENGSQGGTEEEEEEEEGWHVVTHQEAELAENPDVVHQREAPLNLDTDSVLKARSSTLSSSSSSTSAQLLFSQPKATAEIAQLTCVQKAKAWAHRHHESRNAFQRQNRVRGGVQTQLFYVQQPSHRHH